MTRHIRSGASWLGASALLFGCAQERDSHEVAHPDSSIATAESDDQATSHVELAAPTQPGPSVIGIGPMDVSTGLGLDAELQLTVSNLGSPVGTELLKKLSSVVTLRTWPELELVPVNDATIEDIKADGDAYAHVFLSPKANLSDRWYAVVVGQLPEELTWANDRSSQALDSGEHANRFRPDSWPVVRGVELADKEDGKQALYLEFSERVIGDDKLIHFTFSDGSALPCERQPTTFSDEQTSEPFQALQLVCDQVLDLERARAHTVYRHWTQLHHGRCIVAWSGVSAYRSGWHWLTTFVNFRPRNSEPRPLHARLTGPTADVAVHARPAV